ncbi:MAG: class I adenylate-forming enzyme family protein [Verrucomicrobiales bacterium]|nr:class I adenylate-forming enzyme family protein [Verrucomicrobiales bacterium]
MSHIPTLAQTWQPGTGVAGLLFSAARARPEAVYLKDRNGTVLTFAETEEKVRALAGFLSSRGVKRGDRVAIHLRNRVEIAISLFAVAQLGAVYVVLNSRLKPRGLEKILTQAEPVAIIFDETTASNLGEIDPIETSILIGGSGGEKVDLWDEAVSHEPRLDDWSGVDVDAACLVFTSGSTGAPRGVTLSHDNITYVVGAIQERLQYRSEDTIGCFLPLAFDYGLYQIFLAAYSGAKLYIGDPEQVGPRLPQVLKNAAITVLPGVPSVYAALITLGRRRTLDLPHLRAITNTGERLPLSYIEELQGMISGLQVFVMYGLTECKRVSIMTPHEFLTHPDSVGRALEGTEVYAIDDDGNRLPPGQVGELVVRGRHVAHGYWRAPEETAKRFRKRAPESAVELFTGDSGSVDVDGFLYFSARSDDLLKHRGNRISPVEIESEACTIEGVVEASLLKRDRDDTLHLFVTTSVDLEKDPILRRLSEILEPAKVPEFVIFLSEMPKSMNGKIDRNVLLAALEN